MTQGRRLHTAGAFLALTAALVCTTVWGEPSRDPGARATPPPTRPLAAGRPERLSAEELAATRFTDHPVITYRTQADQLLFALQIKPQLPEAPARPTDWLVLVDTSASQVVGPLASARLLTEALVEKLAARADDRLAIWTINIPSATRDLTRGFDRSASPRVQEALKALQDEVPFGACDLKTGLQKAIDAFDRRDGRQRAIVFLGDGMSAHNPLNAVERARLCDQMIGREITLFSVPMGKPGQMEPVNLHGLATGTGGQVVRVLPADTTAVTLDHLFKAVATPVLYPRQFDLPAAAAYYPVKLPPVRSDAPLLVVGQLKPEAVKDGQPLAYTLTGTVAGREAKIPEVSVPLPPAEFDHFFLKGMVDQWAQKERRELPTPFQADRALAMTFERARLAREELLIQGQWAIEQNQFDVAGRLFNEAQMLNPADGEAAANARIADLLLKGKVTRKQLREQLLNAGDNPKARAEMLQQMAQADDKPEKVPAPAAGPAQAVPTREPLIDQQNRQMAVEEQHLGDVVTEVEREARRILATDPERAHEILKRTLASVRDNPDLGNQARTTLLNRLENSLRTVDRDGMRVKRDLEERMRLAADAARRTSQLEASARADEQIQRQIAEFNNLMNKGREELAYQEAQAMQQDALARGSGIVPAQVAAAGIGLTAFHLREVREIRRANEERYLLAMLQVDKSHIPFPDEPPVQFPPAATWRRINDLRKGLYDAVGLGEDSPRQVQAIQRELEKLYNLEKGIDPGTPFSGAIEYLNDRYNLNLWLNDKAFKQLDPAFNVGEQPVGLQKFPKISMATVLRLLCDQVRLEGAGYKATFLIRKDLIEITTTFHAAAEKTVRAYPVADLVIAIPNSINQQGLNQSLNTVSQFQQAQNPYGFAPVPQFNNNNGNNGNNPFANNGNNPFGQGQNGNNPLGNNNPASLYGPNVGNNQFGNLGGQFGLQGADQSRQLLELIVDVIGLKNEWRPLRRDQSMNNPNPLASNPAADPADTTPLLDEQVLNSLGYYSPARALIIRGSSRVHTRPGGELNIKPPGANPGAMAPGEKRPDVAVAAKDKPEGPVQVAGVRDQRPARDLDPRTVWQEALAKGVKNPRAIVECADFLVEHRKFDHAAEFLKAALRTGLADQPWAFEALAVSLQMTSASADEIERAIVSGVDLQPTDAQAYLKAARALAGLKDHAQAVAYCRQAARLQPNDADNYSTALAYAHDGKDGPGMAWAASQLLAQDWPLENEALHATAQQQLEDLARALDQEKRHGESEQMLAAVQRSQERDLVIRLGWQGDALLDLKVAEPSGTLCSSQQRQTPGGGTFSGDTLSNMTSQSYTASEAFSGNYEVTVLKAWGRPVGAKATIEVIRHQGTPQERSERHVLAIDTKNTLTVPLTDGRRTTLASVPPPSVRKQDDSTAATAPSVAMQLRMMTSPVIFDDVSIRGGQANAPAPRPRAEAATARPTSSTTPVAQEKVASFVSNALEMTRQTTVSSEGIRVRLNPVFQSVGRGGPAVVNNPVIPGSN